MHPVAEELFWQQVRHLGRRQFLRGWLLRDRVLPLMGLIAVVGVLTAEPPPATARAALTTLALRFVGGLVVALPLAHWWGRRFWTRCEARYGGAP